MRRVLFFFHHKEGVILLLLCISFEFRVECKKNSDDDRKIGARLKLSIVTLWSGIFKYSCIT